MEFLFKRDRFDYPVFVDMSNAIDHLNQFPQKPEYQCFLLYRDNKVLMIGNPVLNPKIWDLYKKRIFGEKSVFQEKTTTVEVKETVIDFGTIKTGDKKQVSFQITNTGNVPLIINRVSTSCGCTVAEWDKKPLEQGKTTEIKVTAHPEEVGYFNKTIEVYCNINESPVKLTISGTADN
jgi:hypothetical protein